jgi:hypothetical protein
MGTSATAVFKDGNQKLAVLWKHGDGHPDSFGLELADFLDTRHLVNGIGTSTVGIANGMGDLAAQAVLHFKSDYPVGGVYLAPAGTKLGDSDYCYNVQGDTFAPKDGVKIVVYAQGKRITKKLTPAELVTFCKEWK